MTINLKALPQNNEAEQAVLGSILIDQDAMNLALEEIVESDFYDENHKKIFSAMVDLDKESKPIDILTLYDKLKSKKSLLKDVGGSSYLSQLIEIVPSSSNVVFYAKSVKEKSILRSMIRTASEIIDEGQTAEVEVDETAKEDAKEEDKVEEKADAKDDDKVEEASKDDADDKVEEKADADKDEDVKEATDEDEKTDEATEEKDENVEENFADQITPEGEDDMGGDAADDMIADIEDGEGEEDKGDDEDLEDRVVDLEDALDDLKAEFDTMMSDEKGDDDKGDDDMEMDMDAGDDEGDEEKEDEAEEIAPEADLEQPAFENAEKPVQSSAELMREYVSKVSPKMGDSGTDGTKSPVAGKNDMGGDASNIAKGGEETGGKADAPKEDSAGNVNVPGGKASKSMSKDSKGHGAEKKGAGEKGADSKSTIGS